MNVELPYQDILYEHRNGAAWIILNRPSAGVSLGFLLMNCNPLFGTFPSR